MTRGQLRVLRDDTELLLPGQRLLAELVPATVELALVLVRPLLRHVMRRVGRAGGEVHEERLVRHQRLLLAHPRNRAIREIFGERVAFLRRLRRLDGRGALVQARVVLVRLTADEAVEMLEAGAGRPLVERTHRGHLPVRHLMTLTELRGGIAVQLQDLGERRFFLGTDAVVARRRGCHLGDRAHPDRVVVAAREQRLTGRRTERRGVEADVLEPALREPLGRGRVARTAERRRGTEAGIVDQHDAARSARRLADAAARSAGTSCSDPWRRMSSARPSSGPGSEGCPAAACRSMCSFLGSNLLDVVA